jgi:sulfoxide reductase heme-binding subunit YedZ
MITRNTGDWALRLLLLALAITPLRYLTGWHVLIDYRRLIGLLGFFYALVHLASYISFDHVFDASAILEDVFKRPFITLGMLSLMLLLPLALTSTNAWVRRLGARRWLRLHRLVYAAAIVAVWHFWWMVKRDISEPLLYAVLLTLLLGWRLKRSIKSRT